MNSDNNVVSLFEARKNKNEVQADAEAKSSNFDANDFFASIMKKNQENKSKAQNDRLKSNKSVLRSYRIKDK